MAEISSEAVSSTEQSPTKSASDSGEDDNLSGFEYMKKYYTCPKPFRRQQIAKNMIEIFGSVMGNKTSEDEFFEVFEALVNDKDVAVRTDIMEQSGKLATVLFAMSMSEQFSHYGEYISHYILRSIYKMITDNGPQVRKTSTIALLSLIENKILSEDQIVEDVLPLVTEVLDVNNSDDLRTESVSLLVRLATICGRELTLQYFIHKFTGLCRDQVFAVRKTCALNLPQMITIVGPEATETLLLPELKALAKDSVWGVRKISAESVTAFSENVSNRTRREQLSALYLNFLQDNSRWVKIAAFQNLGKFIATFADVTHSGVSLATPDVDSDNPEVVLHPEILSKLRRSNEDTSLQLRWADNVFWNVPPAQIADLELLDDLIDDGDPKHGQTIIAPLYGNPEEATTCSNGSLNNIADIHMTGEDEVKNYSSGESTRESGYASMPFENANTSALGGKKIAGSGTGQDLKAQSDDLDSIYTTRVAAPSSVGDEMVDDDDELTVDEESVGGLDAAAIEQINRQKVVPPDVLFQFVSMCDQKIAQTVDPELARHCAYSIPAIAFTLGRENWNCLRAAYAALAKDMSWKVRRSLAFSLHVMALMLGPEIMMHDLVQVFDSFLNDLDDVKSGILKHFSDFIRLLPAGQHREVYLGRLSGFIKPDNVRNWRFREDLAYQLTQLCELYSSESVKRFIVPLTISLCSDRIAQVRQCSFFLVATIIAKFNRERAFDVANHFKCLLLDRFAKCSMFFGRLTYVQMCEVAMGQSNIDVGLFSRDFLPSLLALHADTVVNIRIALSRTLNALYVSRPQFVSFKPVEPQWTIDDVVHILAQDSDRDVRSFCLKNETIFANSFLNTSEDFDSALNNTASNATFVVSQSGDSSSDDKTVSSTSIVNSQDSPLSSPAGPSQGLDLNQNTMPEPSSNIGRHLKSVLDEITQGTSADQSSDVETSSNDDSSPLSPEAAEKSSGEDEVFLDDTSEETGDERCKISNLNQSESDITVTGDTNNSSLPDQLHVVSEDVQGIDAVAAELSSLVLESEQTESSEDATPSDGSSQDCDSNC